MKEQVYVPCVFCTRSFTTLWLQAFMQQMQARLFDPFNIQALMQQAARDFVVFIHRSDMYNIQQLPNLLQVRPAPSLPSSAACS